IWKLTERGLNGSRMAMSSTGASAVRAKGAASIIRERLSQDVWQLIGALQTRLRDVASLGGGEPSIAAEPEIVDCVERALYKLAALSGLSDENFNRVAGWNFLDLGKRIERAINTCRFARQFADAEPTMDSLDALIELIDSQITYRSRYISGAALAPVLDMAILDPFNPRSVSFQIARMDDHLAALPALVDDGVMEKPRRLAVRLRAELATEEARGLSPGAILKIEQRLCGLADAIAERYFLAGGDRQRPDKRSQLA
ncbi:MAG: alpha-E domain-containing protein, partial [Methylocystis sp.]